MSAQLPFRIIHFAGMEWLVRQGKGNPDNNYWNDSNQSVWVDDQHRLHLKIRKINGIWTGAEIRSLQPTHYGLHRFYVDSRIDLLDKNVVAGLFLYKTYLKEADIEFSKWGQNNAPNAQYVIQPEIPQNTKKFNLHLQGNYTTHVIDWQKEQLYFKSFNDHNFEAPLPSYQITEWYYPNKTLIDDNRYFIHINLWLSKARAPEDLKEAELIIKSVDTPVSAVYFLTPNSYKDLTVYPNITRQRIQIVLRKATKMSYELYDYKDFLIIKKSLDKPKANIDISLLKIGKYRLVIKSGSNTYRFWFKKNY